MSDEPRYSGQIPYVFAPSHPDRPTASGLGAPDHRNLGEEMGPIGNGLTLLAESLRCLVVGVERLEARLKPVLSDNPPPEEEKNKKEPGAGGNSAASLKLDELRIMVHAIHVHINEIIRRVET